MGGRRALLAVALVALAGRALACTGDDPSIGTQEDAGATSEGGGSGTDAGGQTDGSNAADGSDACALTCSGKCTNTVTDRDHCGACGHACKIGVDCIASRCGNEPVGVASAGATNGVWLQDGTVWTWGGGYDCDAGVTNSAVPVKVATLDQIADVKIGDQWGCALLRDGTVWCWGMNGSGQLGKGPGGASTCGGYFTTPLKVAIPGNAPIAQMSTSNSAVCVRTAGATGGDLYCWGANWTGIMGTLDSGISQYTPVKMSAFAADVLAVSLASGTNNYVTREHACALRSDNTIWCWGHNFYGQLGHAPGDSGDVTCTDGSSACNPTPHQIAGSDKFTQVHTGNGLSCGVQMGGIVKCWGSNQFGLLGLGGAVDTTAHPTPLQVMGLNTTAKLFTGGFNAFAQDSNGGVRAWGWAVFGAIGNGDLDGVDCESSGQKCRTTPVDVPTVTGATQIAIRNQSAVAIVPDAGVVSWGLNASNELGHAKNTNDDQSCFNGLTCNPLPKPVQGLP